MFADNTPTISVHIPQTIARKLLEQAGWTRGKHQQYVSPSGEYFWCLDEAVTVMLGEQANN